MGKTTATRPIFLSLVSLSLLAAAPRYSHAGVQGESAEHVPVSRTFPLKYVADGMSLDTTLTTDGREVAFKQEPDFGEREVVRGAVITERGGEGFIGFAWDEAEAKLYLDLNRNLDLTDDPSGVFESDGPPFYQVFKDIPLATGGTPPRRYLVNMRFWGRQRRRGSCSVSVRSGWRGEIDLAGQRWLMAVVDDVDSSISTTDAFAFQRLGRTGEAAPIPSDSEKLDATRKLFLGEESYDLAFEFVPGAEDTLLAVTFTTVDAPTGELRLEGTHIERIVLKGDRTAILDRPGSSSTVAAGSYGHVTAFVSSPEGKERYQADVGRFSVRAGGTTDLKIGAPLDNTVKIKRSGRSLELAYALKGVGGRSYERLAPSGCLAPQFTVSQGGHEVFSGTFEYG